MFNKTIQRQLETLHNRLETLECKMDKMERATDEARISAMTPVEFILESIRCDNLRRPAQYYKVQEVIQMLNATGCQKKIGTKDV